MPCCPNPASAQFPNGSHELGSVTYGDVRASWKTPLATPLTVTGGVRNVWAKDPPVCLSCSLNGYDASNYDLPGQPAGGGSFGLSYQRVALEDAAGWLERYRQFFEGSFDRLDDHLRAIQKGSDG